MEKITSLIKRKRIPRAKSVIEREVWKLQGLVCGVDEVGRGCLAGPVVTAAVVLFPKMTFALLKDSKLLTKEHRVRAARWIKEHSWYAYGFVSHREIDQVNIYQATILAMRRAVFHVCASMPCLPSRIVIDALPLTFDYTVLNDIPVDHFPFAEQRSISVAAASILAKVKRDELMGDFEKIFPGYALSLHKGYATVKHRTCVAQLGSSIIHRRSFIEQIVVPEEKGEYELQGSIFCRGDTKLPDAL